MKDRRGPAGIVGELASSLAAGARRRQREREPRVVVYDAEGHGRTLAPDDPRRDELLAAGRELILLGRDG